MRLMFAARAINRMAGGVERMITMVTNEMAVRGHEVDLLTWDLPDAEPFYPISTEVSWHRLAIGDPKLRASSSLMLRRAYKIRALVKRRRPHAVVCFQDGPFMAISGYTFGFRIPIIAAERNAPSRFDHISAARYQQLIYQAFRLAARITIQCESYRTLYPAFLQGRIVCISNPVVPAANQARPDMPGTTGRYRLLSVGRLGFQKNYPALIEAFARIAPKQQNWDLAIIGEGADRAAIEAMIRRHSLEDRVTLAGVVAPIDEWYASSHLFCLPSRWEGFPNALAEALAHGLPAVGFSECAGVRDLIAHGRSGLLAAGNGDAESLAAALAELTIDGEARRSMGDIAVRSVQQYHPAKIFSQWEQLLSEVAQL